MRDRIGWIGARGIALVLAALILATGCARPEQRPENQGAAQGQQNQGQQNQGQQNQGQQNGQQQNQDQQRIRELEAEVERLRAGMETEEQITLYFARNLPTELRLVPELRKVKKQENMPMAALQELIKGPSTDELDSLIPVETRVLSVDVRNFVAYADFSPDITGMAVGSSGEALVVAAIANTLIKFPGIEKVQILVGGQQVETLAGHVDISRPVGRSEQLLLLPEGGQ